MDGHQPDPGGAHDVKQAADMHRDKGFDIVAGDYWPKPHRQIYDELVRRHNVDPTRAAFADDIAINLKPAADMGMRTIWIRTDESVPRAAGLDLDHVHHQTDDLATWLAEWVAERNTTEKKA